jgi:hypothetical protein
MPSPRAQRAPLCPSAQPGMDGAFAFAVAGVRQDGIQVGYLQGRVPVTGELLALAGPVKPTEVFRFAAPCAGSGCRHYDGSECRLASKFVQLTPPVTRALPACTVRPDCRWWRQEGKAACMRCPQVVTEMYEYSDAQARAADPTV